MSRINELHLPKMIQFILRNSGPLLDNGQYKNISADNPIHFLLNIEKTIFGPRQIGQTYDFLSRTIRQMREISLKIDRTCIDKKERALRKMKALYKLVYPHGAASYQPVVLLSEAVKKGYMDCDTGAYVYLAVAHELRWPLTLVDVQGAATGKELKLPLKNGGSGHVFVRWHLKGGYLNFETTSGKEQTGLQLLRALKTFSVKEIHLPKDSDHLKAIFFKIASDHYEDTGNYQRAVFFYEKAIRLEPFLGDKTNLSAFYKRAGKTPGKDIVKLFLTRKKGNKNNTRAAYFYALAENILTGSAQTEALTKAIKFYRGSEDIKAWLYCMRATYKMLKPDLSNLKEMEADYLRAISLSKNKYALEIFRHNLKMLKATAATTRANNQKFRQN